MRLRDSVCGVLGHALADVRTGVTILFIPKLPEAYGVWMGPIKGLDSYQTKYAVDQVRTVQVNWEALRRL
jgi:Xaa-Pro dipeptidase